VTVTVVEVVPSAGTEVALAATVETLLLGGAAVKVIPVLATATASTVAVRTGDPVARDETLPVATPAASVVAAGWTSVAEPVAERTTTFPGTGFPYASFTVAVTVAFVPSSGTDVGFAARAEVAALGAAGVNVTVAGVEMATGPGRLAVTVFASAFVEESAPLAWPLASVAAEGCVIVFAVPVLAKVTATPGTTFP
jgi:hypothetical protein